MSVDLSALKYQLHAARVSLDYQLKTKRTGRGASREEQIAVARARVAVAEAAYKAAIPEPVSLDPKSIYFIGPKRKKGVRGNGPTIKCFRCEHVKPKEEFPQRGTICTCCASNSARQWALKNPEKRKQSVRGWDERNREKKKASTRAWGEKNKDWISKRNKEHGKKEHVRLRKNSYAREYMRQRKKRDPQWRALLTCKRRMWILFKSAGIKKNLRSAELLGIDRAGFFKHIESLWLPGMSWENRGRWGWHIDHKKPCSRFDMTDPAQAKACWHYTNLQPLWWRDNLSKSDSYTEPAEKVG